MEPFTFRKATEKDLQTATALIEQAKVFLRENGVDQWQTCLLYTSDAADD